MTFDTSAKKACAKHIVWCQKGGTKRQKSPAARTDFKKSEEYDGRTIEKEKIFTNLQEKKKS